MHRFTPVKYANRLVKWGAARQIMVVGIAQGAMGFMKIATWAIWDLR